MTFLLAAFLGNVCAWCVHSVTWWLREKCLWLIAIIGAICTLFFLLSVSMSLLPTGKNLQNQFLWTHLVTVLAPLALLLIISGTIAFLHSLWLGEKRGILFLSFLSVFAETAAAGFAGRIFFAVALLPYEKAIGELTIAIFFYTFTITLFVFALIRPQVVKVQKWLWQTAWIQRATDN